MTAEIPASGPAWRAAEIRAADFERLGFRNPFRSISTGEGKFSAFPRGQLVVCATAPCGKILRAGLTGPIQPCGPRCDCIKGGRA